MAGRRCEHVRQTRNAPLSTAGHGPQREEACESLRGLLVLLRLYGRDTCGLGEQSEHGELHNGPQEVPALIPGACDYVTLQVKGALQV